jgi:hypothetical protein
VASPRPLLGHIELIDIEARHTESEEDVRRFTEQRSRAEIALPFVRGALSLSTVEGQVVVDVLKDPHAG